MIVRPAGGTGCDGCDPYTTLIMRLEALEERANAIVKSVQGILPDGVGNVTLDTESDTTDPSWGAANKLATGSLVKEIYQENHDYTAAVADDVVDLLADVSELQTQVEALSPASVTALENAVASLQSAVAALETSVTGKVNRTGDTMTGPLNLPAIASNDSSSKAATTTWVNDIENDVVHKSRAETIPGAKTFTCTPIIKTLYANAGSIPTTDVYLPGLVLYGADDKDWGTIRIFTAANSEERKWQMYINNANPDGSVTTTAYLQLVNKTSTHEAYATAPTTPSAATSDEIATANWVRSLLNTFAANNGLTGV